MNGEQDWKQRFPPIFSSESTQLSTSSVFSTVSQAEENHQPPQAWAIVDDMPNLQLCFNSTIQRAFLYPFHDREQSAHPPHFHTHRLFTPTTASWRHGETYIYHPYLTKSNPQLQMEKVFEYAFLLSKVCIRVLKGGTCRLL